MATCVDVSGASYPEIFNDSAIYSMEGVSLANAFDNRPLDREAIYWEHEGNRAIRIGDWKLVSKAHRNPRELDLVEELPLENWELYNLSADRTETNDLASTFPDKVEEMSDKWMVWARHALVIPKPAPQNN
jgi:arylsulfatase